MANLPRSQVDAYERGNSALLGLIRGERASSRSPRQRRRRAEAKLARTRALLDSLGNPQRCYDVVHVTGTSGKGSTCAAIAAILTAAGYRVGLRTSPYLQVATEKLQIGSSLIDGESFEHMVRLVLDQSEQIDFPNENTEPLHYAEAWASLALTWFAERQVDVAVVEVGAGGRFDSTNAVDPVVSVITSVGLDHVVSLGPTIADIAWHKAGIIKPGSTTVVGPLPADARAVVTSVAEAAGSQLIDSSEGRIICETRADAADAGFQRQNACTAYAVISSLRERGFAIPESAVVEGLANARLPGRFERMPDEQPSVWLDGAHNADKMAALAAELNRRQDDAPLPVAMLGVLSAKDASTMISRLNGVVSTIVATEPQVIGKRALSAPILAQLVSKSGFEGKIICETNADIALDAARQVALSQGAEVFVTGSLYLVGQMRRHWYPNDEIVAARSPWPSAARSSTLGVDRALGRLVGDKTDD